MDNYVAHVEAFKASIDEETHLQERHKMLVQRSRQLSHGCLKEALLGRFARRILKHVA